MQFRLHIDIPLGYDEYEAIEKVRNLIHWHFCDPEAREKIMRLMGNIEEVNYRLGHDEDRQKSNYLQKTDTGHVTNKKCRLGLSFEEKV